MINNKLTTTNSELSITNLGQIFSKSGYFQDARDAAKAVVKILAGQELGLPPIASMTGINIIKGKVTLSAVAMATVLKKSGKYDYRILENTETSCKIEFFQEKESLGISEFTFADAKRADLTGKDNYKKYPRNMLYARAMSNGIRWFCPDVLGGPSYTPGELDENLNEANDDWVEGEISEIDEFAEWMEKEEDRQEKLNEAKEKVLLLAKELDLQDIPPVFAASQILPKIKDKYPDLTDKDVEKMLT